MQPQHDDQDIYYKPRPDPLMDGIRDALQLFVDNVLLFDDIGQETVRPDDVAIAVVESEQNSVVMHLFAGGAVDVMLRHHHTKGVDDIIRFSNYDGAGASKELSFVEMGSVTFSDAPARGSIRQALFAGIIELEKSKQRLHAAILDVNTVSQTRENITYTAGVPRSKVTPLSAYTDLNLPF